MACICKQLLSCSPPISFHMTLPDDYSNQTAQSNITTQYLKNDGYLHIAVIFNPLSNFFACERLKEARKQINMCCRTLIVPYILTIIHRYNPLTASANRIIKLFNNLLSVWIGFCLFRSPYSQGKSFSPWSNQQHLLGSGTYPHRPNISISQARYSTNRARTIKSAWI